MRECNVERERRQGNSHYQAFLKLDPLVWLVEPAATDGAVLRLSLHPHASPNAEIRKSAKFGVETAAYKNNDLRIQNRQCSANVMYTVGSRVLRVPRARDDNGGWCGERGSL